MTENAVTPAGQDWEEQARNWIAWVRKPGFDSYWRYRDAFFALVPSPGRATLDLGCGEGRVSRDLVGRGHRVTGIDASPTLVEAAREADPDGRYLVTDAADLPFPDDGFDLVVAYNVLMDVDDLPGTVAEIGRVLEPGGRLCLSITHPITNTGSLRDGLFVLDRPYFGRHRFEEEVERDGMRMKFQGWNHPLSAYTEAMEDAGLLVEALREPRVGTDPSPGTCGSGRSAAEPAATAPASRRGRVGHGAQGAASCQLLSAVRVCGRLDPVSPPEAMNTWES